MSEKEFIDYYDVLQLSQGADAETVERVYRLLAKRYHPDNQGSGDSARFAAVHDAYQVLSDPKRRAEYDVKYDENRSMQWRIFDQGSAHDGREEDRRIFHGVLSLLYVARRRDPQQGGLGTVTIEKLLGVPRQHLDFPIWYLRQRGWIETLDSGQLGITVSGIDKLSDRELSIPEDRLLAASSVVGTRSGETGAAPAEDTREPAVPADGPSAPAAPPKEASAGRSRPASDDAPPTPDAHDFGNGAFPAESEIDPPAWDGDGDDEASQARGRTREVAARLRGSRP